MLSAIQTRAVVVVRERSRSAHSARTEERGSSGDAVRSPGSTGLPYISVSTSAASSLRPWRARKYGFSGNVRRTTKARKAGDAAARKSQRQLFEPPTSRPMKIHEEGREAGNRGRREEPAPAVGAAGVVADEDPGEEGRQQQPDRPPEVEEDE